MTLKKKANFQAHPFHLVSPSPWPLYTSSILFATILSSELTFHNFSGALKVLYTLLFSVADSMCLWIRDVINEATFHWFFKYNLAPLIEDLAKSHYIVTSFLAIVFFLFGLSMLFTLSDVLEERIFTKNVSYVILIKYLKMTSLVLILILIAFFLSLYLTDKLINCYLVEGEEHRIIVNWVFILFICGLLITHIISNRHKIRMSENLKKKKASGSRILAPLSREPHLMMQSSLDTPVIVGVTAYTVLAIIVKASAFLFAVAMYLDMFSTHLAYLPVHVILNFMNLIIENTQRISRGVTTLLENPDITRETFTQIHGYLTPYIRSNESLFFDFLLRMFRYFEGNIGPENFRQLEYAFEDFRAAASRLLRVYRSIERVLDISIGDSPIPLQDVEN